MRDTMLGITLGLFLITALLFLGGIFKPILTLAALGTFGLGAMGASYLL